MPRLLASLALAAVAGTGLVAFAPAFKYLVQGVLNSPRHDLRLLWEIIGGVFLINVVANVSAFGSAYLTAWTGQRLTADLRVRVLARALGMPSLAFDQWRPGELLARATNDLTIMGDAVSIALPQFVQVAVTFTVSLAYMLYTDWFLTLVLLVIAPVISYAVAQFQKSISASSLEAQSRVAEVTANLSEVLYAQRIVKAFRRENFEVARFRSTAEHFFRASLRLTKVMQLQIPVIGMLIVSALLTIVYLSAREVMLGRMDTGSVFQFWTLVSLSINPISRITAYFGDIARGVVSATRIYEILDLPLERDVPADPVELTIVDGALDFIDVRFQYPSSDVPVLAGFNLHISAGMVVALVGPSGAGKTTIAQLIPRFYELSSGRILLDGIDVTRIALGELREAIGIVPQEPQLFRATIAENIRYGRLDATDAEVAAAAREANAEEFILDLPLGYGTLLGENGTRLSGGQRQRIAIARAIVRRPKIIILDEATSALDSHSEALIEEAFERVFRGRTTIVIAHRLSTIRRADRIVYVEAGAIREDGTHDELLERGGLYYHLYSTQVGRF